MDRRDSVAVTSTWQEFLLYHTDQDLLSIAEGSRLYYGNNPIHLHWLDQVCLLLVRQAYIRHYSLALSYPVPVCNLPMLAATQVLIHDFVQKTPVISQWQPMPRFSWLIIWDQRI